MTTAQEVKDAYVAWKDAEAINPTSPATIKAAAYYGKLAGEITLAMVGEEGFTVQQNQLLLIKVDGLPILRLSGLRTYLLTPLNGLEATLVANTGGSIPYTVVDGIAVPVGG